MFVLSTYFFTRHLFIKTCCECDVLNFNFDEMILSKRGEMEVNIELKVVLIIQNIALLDYKNTLTWDEWSRDHGQPLPYLYTLLCRPKNTIIVWKKSIFQILPNCHQPVSTSIFFWELMYGYNTEHTTLTPDICKQQNIRYYQKYQIV